MDWYFNNTISFILFLGAALYFLLMLIYLIAWENIASFKIIGKELSTFISVVIPARNEEKNIIKCLDSIVNQDFPFQLCEIIVVDDHSTDNTAPLIQAFIEKKSSLRIKLIRLTGDSETARYKKNAITAAVQEANGTLIVTTDSDCTFSPKWLRTLTEFYETQKVSMISAPVIFTEGKSAFSQMQTMEFLGLVGIGAASVQTGFPLMCNGANLAYEKTAFEKAGGYSHEGEPASGDDIFLMLRINNLFSGRVKFLKSEDALVYTPASATISDFFEQRKRWASKGTLYKDLTVVIVAVVTWLSNFAALSSILYMLFSWSVPEMILRLLMAKMIIEFFFLAVVHRYFKKTYLLFWFLPAFFVNIFYVVVIGIAGLSRSYQWKGREVKK